MEKTCPRCGGMFTCRQDEVEHCDCHRIPMDDYMRDFLHKEYGDRCLCKSCLESVARQTQKKL